MKKHCAAGEYFKNIWREGKRERFFIFDTNILQNGAM